MVRSDIKCNVKRSAKLRSFILLFSLFVLLVLFATLAKFVHFQAIFEYLLIFGGKIIDTLALSALHFYHVVLGHTVISYDVKIVFFKGIVRVV